jgi:hypothetical protein
MAIYWVRPVARRLVRLLVLAICIICSLLFAYEPLSQRAGSADVGRRPPAFAEAYPYADGLEVEVTEVWIGRRLGVPVVELTVEVSNHSAHTFEAWLRGELRYGAQRRPAVRYLTPPGPGDIGSVQLIAIGESSDPYRLCFVLPPDSRGDVVFELGIDAGAHDPAVFAGEL